MMMVALATTPELHLMLQLQVPTLLMPVHIVIHSQAPTHSAQ